MTNQLDELERLLAKATAGPWEYDDGRTDGDERGKQPWITTRNPLKLIASPDGSDNPKMTSMPTEDAMDANAALIVALRNNAEKLLRVVRAAQAVRKAGCCNCEDYDALLAALKAMEGGA